MKLKRILSILLVLAMTVGMMAGCGKKSSESADDGKSDGAKEEIVMWFWGAEPYAQKVLNANLADKYNASQDKYTLKIEYRNSVDSDMTTALAANKGPDIVYGSGPSFVMPLVEAGKLEPMDKYAEQYGWADRILKPIYESGTVDGKLYSLANSLNTVGVFYNKKVLEDNGWAVPTTVAEMEKIMDEAMAKGMYASVTGNKGWKPVNENYASLFLTHYAGADTVYKCLKGEEKWNNEAVVSAIEKSAEWYDKGYLAGKDYGNMNFSEALQMLADERSPFFIGPTLGYQWAQSFFTDDKVDNLAFIPFPATDKVTEPTYTLSVCCTFSINANVAQDHKDEAAKIIDIMMQPEFTEEMTSVWPGYWGTPLKDLSTVDVESMTGLSKSYMETIKNIAAAVNDGNFGYYTNVFFPSATQQVFIDIENVWYGTESASDLMDKADTEFTKELEKGLVPPVPQAGVKAE
ncbi:ABC transporter substrate-binding protein [Anaerobium acetethylicum]|uniref:Raffinose/stachyose/melibiose transport system substrate-binding protein n=1 Tax=Anaerobium acetethylicum TaxID=1619234 RepID=A0A1D3TTG7_9FIRM|nr:ABC transporter substrate-binding protein [Anaerobium acetethylicum]SCP97245.1 raffinose/stachyose/melibiose transport system substrate-binding protein [Anaerobium acetethylicum]